MLAVSDKQETNQVIAKIIENTKRKVQNNFIGGNAKERFTVCTDDIERYESTCTGKLEFSMLDDDRDKLRPFAGIETN